MPERAWKWFAGLTVAKIVVFLLATSLFHVRPFAGANTTSYFIPIAHRLVTQGSFNDATTRDYNTVPPGYPFVLSLCYRFAGSWALPALVCLQFLADLLVAFLLLELGKRWGNWAGGAGAGAIWLVFPPAVVMSVWITPETLFTAFFMSGLLLICQPGKYLSGAVATGAGLVFGVATLIRGNTLLIPAVLVPFWLWKRRYWAAISFVLAFALPVGLWALRNYAVLGDPIISSSNLGSVFLQGSDERFYHDKETEYPALFEEAARAGFPKPGVETSSNISAWLFRVGLHHYRSRLQTDGVLPVAAQLLSKLGYMWFLTESGSQRSQWLLSLCALVIAPLGLWQLARWLWTGDPVRIIPAVVVVSWIAFEMLILPLTRYTLPIMPVILLAACCARFLRSSFSSVFQV